MEQRLVPLTSAWGKMLQSNIIGCCPSAGFSLLFFVRKFPYG
jgi:hypothetical protein